MFKGIDIRYATRATDDDRALMDLRAQLRAEHDHHQSLTYKMKFLGDRLQAALNAGRTDNAVEAATLFARLKEDLTIRLKNIIDLNREIAAIDSDPQPTRPAPPFPDQDQSDALIARVLKRISNAATPNPIPS